MMNSRNKSCKTCQNKSRCFMILNDNELEEIDKFRVEIRHKKGELICKQGSRSFDVTYIQKGLAKIYFESEKNPLILRVIKEGTMFGLPSINSDTYNYSVSCYTDTIACHIDKAKFLEFLQNNPRFATEIITDLNDSTLNTYKRIACVTQDSLPARLASTLLCLYDNITNNPVLDIPITRLDLSELTNMSQESISRIIRDFRNNGVIRLKNKIIVLEDMDYLRGLCN